MNKIVHTNTPCVSTFLIHSLRPYQGRPGTPSSAFVLPVAGRHKILENKFEDKLRNKCFEQKHFSLDKCRQNETPVAPLDTIWEVLAILMVGSPFLLRGFDNLKGI